MFFDDICKNVKSPLVFNNSCLVTAWITLLLIIYNKYIQIYSIRSDIFNIIKEKKSNSKNKSENGVPFIVTYNPYLSSVYSIIKKNVYLHNMDQKVEELFSSQPMVSFCGTCKLVAVWFERNSVLWKEGWVQCCYNHCQVCRSITETDMFIFNNGQRSHKINHSFDCH